MRIRRLVAVTFVTGFVALVVHVAAANQCPASELGACARLHLALMRPPSSTPIALVAPPMRAAGQG